MQSCRCVRRSTPAIRPTIRAASIPLDLIINLVALGMGVGFVPARALALYHRKRTLRRIPWPERFVRELVVVVRRHRELSGHLAQFIDNVLF